MADVPMKDSIRYPAQINLKVEIEQKKDTELLKGQGVDVATLYREAIRERTKEALKKLGLDRGRAS